MLSIRVHCAVSLLLVVSARCLAQGVSQESLNLAKAVLHEAIGSGDVAGGAHMVVKDGKVIYFEVAGLCDVEDETPLRPNTIMRIYSMTKPITSVAAMTLYEQGKFQLDDPISRFIPAFEKTTVFVKDENGHQIVPAKRQITIRDVFRHTTGYGYGGGDIPELREHYHREGMRYWPPHAMMPPKLTITDAAEALARIPAHHHPGERFTYGFSTDLLGRLIEVWSGKPLDEYLSQSIFEPLSMVDTGFSVPPGKHDRFATCHTWKDGRLAIADKASDSPYTRGFQFLSGGGGLVSTMQDYANFCQMLVEGGEFKGKQVLTEPTIRLMFTDQLKGIAGGFRFGLAFAIAEVSIGNGNGKRTAAQYSWGGYASTDFRLVPDEKLFQIIMRQRVPSSHDLANKLIPIVYEGME